MIQTPDHSSYPSGHAAEAFAIATVLDALAGGRAYAPAGLHALPFRLAHRIAVNRTVAGLHFPADSLAGAVLGMRIGALAVALASGTAPDPAAGTLTAGAAGQRLGAAQAGALEDFSLDVLAPFVALPQPGPGAAGLLGDLWRRAATEWAGQAPVAP